SAGNGIWALPTTADLKPIPVLQTPFQSHGAQFSPDGKWIAYASNESGRFEIFVQAFPAVGGKWQVSTTGGRQARWSPHAKELFYIALNNVLMATAFRATPDGRAIQAGMPVRLFRIKISKDAEPNTAQYAVSLDGRFLIDTVTDESVSPIAIIRNWKPKP